MSLDVYLYETKRCPNCDHPVETRTEVYSANITHNLNQMAKEAGLYAAMWRPDENGLETASDLLPHLRVGLVRLR